MGGISLLQSFGMCWVVPSPRAMPWAMIRPFGAYDSVLFGAYVFALLGAYGFRPLRTFGLRLLEHLKWPLWTYGFAPSGARPVIKMNETKSNILIITQLSTGVWY